MEGLSLSNIYSYEEYQVQLVLEKLTTTDQNIRPETVPGMLVPPDFFLKDGISVLGLEGPTLVEVKRTLSFSAMKAMESYFETHSQHRYNVLVVFFKKTISETPLPKKIAGKWLNFILFKDLKKKVKNTKIKQEEDYYFDNAKKTDWKNLRKEIIEDASEVVKQGNNVLFLGAGVSTSAKMPTWKDLLKNLMAEVKMLKGDSLKAFTELDSHIYKECGDSNLIMARYLETAIQLSNKNADFMKLIRQHLYSENHTSDLLSDLALIVKARKVDEVITYNFDDILEQELEKQGLKESVNFTTISRDAEVTDHNNLPVYHVHGIIPEHSETTDTVVFSEKEYHDRYRNAYHWSNVEQLHAMMRKHCFFVGLSMQDPNLRRLLDTACTMNATDKPSHYAFLRRTQQENYCLSEKGCQYVQVSKSLVDKKKQKDIYLLNYTVLENIYRLLGVNVVWYEDYNELPDLIEQVFGVDRIQTNSDEELKQRAEELIQAIEKIEKDVPEFNPAMHSLEDNVKALLYYQQYGNEYKTFVHECSDVLQELSNRIDYSVPENIIKLVNNSAKFENLSGFAEFYKKWFESIKEVKG